VHDRKNATRMDGDMIRIPRLPWNEFFMLQAHLIATRSTCDRGPELLFDPGRHGVGCVLVRDNRVLASGYNGSAPHQSHCDTVGHLMVEGHCRRTIHSEANALLQCALDGVSPAGATLYTTASPCFDCAKLILRAKIAKVVWGSAYQSRYGLSNDVEKMFLDADVMASCLCMRREDLE
jgi:deoxycytidylate deaminase